MPILAIAHEIKKLDHSVEIIYVGEKGTKFPALLDDNTDIDQIYRVYAGKFRRFYGESFSSHLLDWSTNLKNIRDICYVIFGIFESILLLRKLKPNIILINGYVGLPIGLSARILQTPFITQDSNAMGNLTNKIVGRWAKTNAVAFDAEYYNYHHKDRIKKVGIPLDSNYKLVSQLDVVEFRRELKIPEKSRVLLLIGGSLGAQAINKAFSSIFNKLIDNFPDIYIIHQVGRGKLGVYDGIRIPSNMKVLEFIAEAYKYSGAADVVIARAGATTLAELAVQGKAAIIIPNPKLTAGHQLKNANQILKNGAGIVI
ncbi:MAG TPA: glycosyltransferase, partial [Candidatus Saccharimonadia bacterium]|nr:glycosyltransferase [Candidatus Saccharimonadia bacterium]